MVKYAGDDVALALYRTDDRSFSRKPMLARPTLAAVPMLVLVFAADEALVDLDNAAELLNILDKRSSDLVAHAHAVL